MLTETCTAHHYLIDGDMLGTCRICGATRQYPQPWLPSADRSARGKRGAQKRVENKAKEGVR